MASFCEQKILINIQINCKVIQSAFSKFHNINIYYSLFYSFQNIRIINLHSKFP